MLNKVRSKKILNIIFGALKKRIELKLLKYNKKMRNKLNLKKEDFEEFILLKEMNLRFNLDIKDIDIKELNLGKMNLQNDIIEYLVKIKFNELKVLNLENNNLSNIKGLENVNFTKLEELNLKYNEIQDIDILEKFEFKKLRGLYLYNLYGNLLINN